MKIYSPEGHVGRASVEVARAPATLSAQRVAVLDNGKPGAQRILECVAEQLRKRTAAKFVGHFRKRTAATPCEDALIDKISEEADLVLTGIAD